MQVLNRVAGNITRNLMSGATHSASGMGEVREGFELQQVFNGCSASDLMGPTDSSFTLCEVYLRMRINCDKVVQMVEDMEARGEVENDTAEIKTIAKVWGCTSHRSDFGYVT